MDARPLQDLIDPGLRPWRLGATMFSVFGGIALGGAAALAVGRFVAPLLFHVSPRDPATLAAVAASGIPAWRASRVDPTAALRSD